MRAVIAMAAGLTAAGLVLLAACESRQAAAPERACTADTAMTPTGTTASPSPPATPTTTTQLATPAAPAAQATSYDEGALHNVHRIGPRLVSAAVPEGDAAFDQMKAMGIKTIISVDGAAPDVERARARGMRYVHIPITYATITPSQQAELARAVRDLPGPVLIHCHHGKHRGPSSAASIAVMLGEATPEQAIEFMKKAGTSPSYAGLYACVMSTTRAGAELDSAPSDFPEVRRPIGMVAAMVGVDHAFEHLGHVRQAGWKVPKDHPDLVPAAEAGRLTDHLRISGEDPRSRALGAAYEKKLTSAIKAAKDLEEAIVAGAKPEALEARWKAVAASCKDCHVDYRDRVRQN